VNETPVIIWTIINSIALCVLAAIQYAVLRQIGIMLVRLGPGYARPLNQGPRIGEYLGLKFEELWAGKTQVRPTLYIFASSLCPICESVRKACKHIASHWAGVADIVFIYEAEESTPQNEARNVLIWSHPRLMDELEIRLVPYGVMTDKTTTVIAHGLLSNASQLESLLELAPGAKRGPEQEFQDRQNQTLPTEVSTDGRATS
jgi:hypothetical protein